jgi:hypothetical protein
LTVNRWLIIGLAAVILGIAAVVWVTSDGTNGDSPSPFSVSDSEVRGECHNGTYVPERAGTGLSEGAPPRDWGAVENAAGAVAADRSAVEVVIRPREGTKRITLTGVDFQPAYSRRPQGGYVFYRRCNRPLVGPALEVDLDPNPVRRYAKGGPYYVIASNASPENSVGGQVHLRSKSPPIRFPWTVSLNKPLRLYLLVRADDSYCVWSASLSWKSGSDHGVIPIDNGGKKYRIVDTIGVPWSEQRGRSKRWISVERLAGWE